MKKTFKAALVLMFLLAVSPFAQSICVDLCTPCVGKKKDQTCKKVEEHCQCTAILDSIKAVQAAKESALAESQNKLSQELLQICNNDVCTSRVSFENGLFKQIALDNSSDAQKSAQALYENNFSSNQTSMTRIEPLPPLNEECSKFCGECPVTDKMLKSKKPKFKDKFCKKIEESCKCIDYAINAKQLEEQAKADSAAVFESKVKRIENAALLAKELHTKCDVNEPCALSVVFANKEITSLDIQKTAVEKEEPADSSTAATTEENTADVSTNTTQYTADNATENVNQGAATQEVSEDKRVFHEVDPSSSFKSAKSSGSRSTYLGFSLAFEFPESCRFYDIYLGAAPKDYDFGIDLGFLFRTYFNKVVSFNLGFNAIFRSAKYDNYVLYADFQTIMAEIPLGFRFGIPLGNLPISPFISTSFHIRKPIYHWIYLETIRSSNYYNDWIEESEDGAAAIYEWEFIPLLGFGLEISRHFSFEFQWYIGESFCTYDGGIDLAYRIGDSWRLKLEAAF